MPSVACASGGATDVERVEVEVAGVVRHALVHLPQITTGTAALPVVLSFHGAGMDAEAQQMIDGLVDLSESASFVAVHPDGLVIDVDDDVQDVTGWDVQGRAVDEPAFVAALLDELASTLCIDTARVFATGSSNGGAMAQALTCEMPGRIAAVAPVAGAYVPMACAEPHSVPEMAFHGLDDLVAPYDGSTAPAQELRPVDEVIAAQAERNGCVGDPTTDSGFGITTTTWRGCDAPVLLVALSGHGHAWPGHPLPVTREALTSSMTQDAVMTAKGLTPETQADNMLLTNTTIDATDMMWRFFVDQT